MNDLLAYFTKLQLIDPDWDDEQPSEISDLEAKRITTHSAVKLPLQTLAEDKRT